MTRLPPGIDLAPVRLSATFLLPSVRLSTEICRKGREGAPFTNIDAPAAPLADLQSIDSSSCGPADRYRPLYTDMQRDMHRDRQREGQTGKQRDSESNIPQEETQAV